MALTFHRGAGVWGADLEQLLPRALTSIILNIYLRIFVIGEPFPIEWGKELPPSDRTFRYRGCRHLYYQISSFLAL